MTTAGEFNCIFCKESFESKEELQIHFRKHGDPKFNQSAKSKSEMSSKGVKSEEGEMVHCDVCEEVFPTISKAITHKHKVHPDHEAKYFCPWCGKLFTMKHLYNKHIQSVHESMEENTGGTGFHCDYCDVDFFLPPAMLYHNKYFHRQDTELAAIGHSRKLKMFNQESLPVYYCPFCGEEYCNKVNLHKHMGDDHIDENQSPEDVLRCPLCDAVFYHLDAYELHLTFHSTDDLYADDNEMAREISEFSLETVSPIMEKVENESLEDIQSLSTGIEDLLQQAMNDSNGDTVREKRKKHKKHKKSKKAAITLDEFLTMNTDLFGEGLDVQGIVEVPTQVVAKSLKGSLPRAKPGPKPLPTELQKLKKAGLTIKKKKVNSLEGMKVVTKNPILQPGLKIKHEAENLKTTSKTSEASSSNDVLSKLNSDIKIVKKSIKLDSSREALGTDKGPPEKEKCEKGSNEIQIQTPELNSHADKKPDIENSADNDKEANLQDFTSDEMKNNTKIPKTAEDVPETNEANNINKPQKEINTNSYDKETHKNETINPLNALRNISQHITIKSLSSQTAAKKLDDNKSDEKKISKSDHEDLNEASMPQNADSSSNSQKLVDNKITINPLQHLSHLTVKHSSTTKIDIHGKTESENEMEFDNHSDDNEHEELNDEEKNSTTMEEKLDADVQNQSSKLAALKNLSKHIIVKSLSQAPNSPARATDKHTEHNDDEEQNYETQPSEEGSDAKNINLINKSIVKSSPTAKMNTSPQHSPKTLSNEYQKQNPISEASNLLKQFPSITAKPVTMQRTSSQPINTSNNLTNQQVANRNYQQNSIKQTEAKQKEIEVFNIDDSDEEENLPSQNHEPSNIEVKSTTKSIEQKVNSVSQNILKNLGSNLTIKSSNSAKLENTNEQVHNEDFDKSDFHDNIKEEHCCLNDLKEPEPKDSLLQNKLKSLSNLTIKSNNTSSKISSPALNPSITGFTEEYESDCSNTSNNVKITELPDDYTSDDDIPLRNMKSENRERTNRTQEDEEDIENQITPSKLLKPTNESFKTTSFSNNLKNVTVKSPKVKGVNQSCDLEDDKALVPYQNKNLSIKRLRPTASPTATEEDNQSCNPEDDKVLVPYQNKNLSIKRLRPTATTEEDNQTTRESPKNVVNREISQGSKQVNTINKEVTVQKFQTQTVVQEITTTVTKTIRTINQTVKQEVQNATQNQSSSIVTPQKIQGMRPNFKNFSGAPVRGKTPTMGPRAKAPATQSQLPTNSNIRPSNQLVSVKPGVNLARPSTPRMQVARRMPTPATNTAHNPVTGKTLRISPNAMMPSSKRQQSKPDEVNGPFSCFKKPKDTLFPVGEEGIGSGKYSSSQMSQSNFVSTTKIMKNNSVVSSTKTKSQMAVSSEQLNRLNNLTGLKVVKTCQSQLISKVEEKTEINPAKRTALETIEKLKKQGLLVKKPKVDEPTIEEPDSDNEGFPEEEEDYYEDT